MTQKWLDNSQVAVGLVLEGRLSDKVFTPEQFYPPYDELMQDIQAGKKLEELVIKHSVAFIQGCTLAASRVNGLGDKTDFPTLLHVLSNKYVAGSLFEKMGKRLQDGQDVDTAKLKEAVEMLGSGQRFGLKLLRDVEPRKAKFMTVGWDAVDVMFGGIPKIGVLEIAGDPKTGKSTMAAKLAGLLAEKFSEKKVIFFTLEMLDEELAMRYLEVFGRNKEVPDNLYVDDHRHNVHDVVAILSGIENIGAVIIDYAEKLVEGETSETKMAEVFKELAFCAKQLKIPIILLASLHRTQMADLPRPNHVRYSGMSEYEVYGCWTLYNPNNDYHADVKYTARDEGSREKQKLPAVEGKAYILGWIQRGGFPVIKGYAGPRAVQVDFDPKKGWGDGDKMYALKNSS